jgi:hypothetical protein
VLKFYEKFYITGRKLVLYSQNSTSYSHRISIPTYRKKEYW